MRRDKQRQLLRCHRHQAWQHPTPSAPRVWCHSPQQELGRVIEPEHVVVVLHIVLIQKCVQLFQLKQERPSRSRELFSHRTPQLPSEWTPNTFCVAAATGAACSRVPAPTTSPAPCCSLGSRPSATAEQDKEQDTQRSPAALGSSPKEAGQGLEGLPKGKLLASGILRLKEHVQKTLFIPMKKPGQPGQRGMGER